MTDEEKLVKLDKLKKDLVNLKEATEQCSVASKSEDLCRTTEALLKGVTDTVETVDNANSQLRLTIATSDEFLNGVNNVTVLLNTLSQDLAALNADQITPTVVWILIVLLFFLVNARLTMPIKLKLFLEFFISYFDSDFPKSIFHL